MIIYRRIVAVALLAVLTASGMYAQKDGVDEFSRKKFLKEVRADVKAEKYSSADERVRKVMKERPDVAADPYVCNLEVNILNDLALQQNRNIFLNQKPDTAKFFSYIYDMYVYGLRCDSLCRIPDAKGRVRNPYASNITDRLSSYRDNLRSGGKYYYKKRDYSSAYKFFTMYLGTSGMDILTRSGDYVADDDIMGISKLTVYSAYAGGHYADAVKYVVVAMGDTVNRSYLCQVSAKSFMELGDTANALVYLKKGWECDSGNPYFYMNLIHLYTDMRNYEEGYVFVRRQLVLEPDNSRLWYIKGKEEEGLAMPDSAIVSFCNAIRLSPDDAKPYNSLAVLYMNKAYECYSNNDFKVGSREYRENRRVMNSYYQQAMEAYEQARRCAPEDESLWAEGLRDVYFRLNKGKELKALEKSINKK